MSRSPWGRAISRGLGDQVRADGSRVGGRLSASGDAGVRLSIDGAAQSDVALAFQGLLQKKIDEDLRQLEGAYWRAMNRVVEAGKGRLRADVAAAGFHRGEALAKTWRGTTYPKAKNSLEVAGWLTTKIGVIIDAFEAGTVIKVRGNQQFLAVPLAPAKAILRRTQREKRFGSRSGGPGRDAFGRYTKDDSYVEQVARALGTDLVPVIAADRQTGVLIGANEIALTRTGRAARVQRKPTPIFALTKSATLRRRLKGRALLAEIERNFPDDFAHALLGELHMDNRS